jgi:OTT_1508-like deaminase
LQQGYVFTSKPIKNRTIFTFIYTENKIIKDLLWNEMLSYHQDRIRNDYIPSVRANFKVYDAMDKSGLIGNHSAANDELSVLRELAFDVTKPGQTTIDKYSKLVTVAYGLRITKSVEEALQSSPSATTKTKKLWIDICLLSRLRVAFQKFEEIALKLPSFNQVTIILLPRYSVSAKPPERPLSLRQTFDILKLSLDSQTVKSMISQRWTLNRVEQEFAKRQKQKLNIHAEVQMLLFLCSNEPSIHALLPYFGCSKYSCFMCARFLQSHGTFVTRGCHGRLFKPWTVPETAGLGLGQANQIAGAILQLQKSLKKELKSTIKKNGRQEKTSAIGGSSILSACRTEGSRRQSDLERRKLKAEQERVAEMFKR